MESAFLKEPIASSSLPALLLVLPMKLYNSGEVGNSESNCKALDKAL